MCTMVNNTAGCSSSPVYSRYTILGAPDIPRANLEISKSAILQDQNLGVSVMPFFTHPFHTAFADQRYVMGHIAQLVEELCKIPSVSRRLMKECCFPAGWNTFLSWRPFHLVRLPWGDYVE